MPSAASSATAWGDETPSKPPTGPWGVAQLPAPIAGQVLDGAGTAGSSGMHHPALPPHAPDLFGVGCSDARGKRPRPAITHGRIAPAQMQFKARSVWADDGPSKCHAAVVGLGNWCGSL